MLLGDLPDELLAKINRYLPSKDQKQLAFASRYFRRVLKPESERQAAEDAAECVINPTKKNVEKLTQLLRDYPALLEQPATVTNRHGMKIRGTVYQIALHEGDDELIEDVLKEGFRRLKDGESLMEAQRQEWLPSGWMEAEESACANAFEAIDKVFDAFESASDPNNVTELQVPPYPITIHHQGAREALEAFRAAIDALYKTSEKAITSGRDPIIRLLDRVTSLYGKKYAKMGGDDSPRNDALARSVLGYCQRYAPINFMQAFAQGPFYIVEQKEKLTRSLGWRLSPTKSILPLDSEHSFRLGDEYYANAARVVRAGIRVLELRVGILQTFCQSKTTSALRPCKLYGPSKGLAQ